MSKSWKIEVVEGLTFEGLSSYPDVVVKKVGQFVFGLYPRNLA